MSSKTFKMKDRQSGKEITVDLTRHNWLAWQPTVIHLTFDQRYTVSLHWVDVAKLVGTLVNMIFDAAKAEKQS